MVSGLGNFFRILAVSGNRAVEKKQYILSIQIQKGFEMEQDVYKEKFYCHYYY